MSFQKPTGRGTANLKYTALDAYLRREKPASAAILDKDGVAALAKAILAERGSPLSEAAMAIRFDMRNAAGIFFSLLPVVMYCFVTGRLWYENGIMHEGWLVTVSLAVVTVFIFLLFGYFLMHSAFTSLWLVFEPDRIRVRRREHLAYRTTAIPLASITGIVKLRKYGPKFSQFLALEIEHGGATTVVMTSHVEKSKTGQVAWTAGLLSAATGCRVTDCT